MDITWYIIIALILLVLATVLGFMLYIQLVFKHRVRIIDLTKQGIELDYKARDYVTNGVKYWQLDKERDKELKLMPIPPSKAINISKGGKKSVEAIRTETGEYIFLDRSLNIVSMPSVKEFLAELPQEIKEHKDDAVKAELIKTWLKMRQLEWQKVNRKNGMTVEAYQPFTSKQRMILMNNFQKANERKGHSWKENLPMIVSVGAIVLLVICLMIFWGDIAQPALEGKQLTKQIVDVQSETVKLLKDMENNQQRIISEVEQIKQNQNG